MHFHPNISEAELNLFTTTISEKFCFSLDSIKKNYNFYYIDNDYNSKLLSIISLKEETESFTVSHHFQDKNEILYKQINALNMALEDSLKEKANLDYKYLSMKNSFFAPFFKKKLNTIYCKKAQNLLSIMVFSNEIKSLKNELLSLPLSDFENFLTISESLGITPKNP